MDYLCDHWNLARVHFSTVIMTHRMTGLDARLPIAPSPPSFENKRFIYDSFLLSCARQAWVMMSSSDPIEARRNHESSPAAHNGFLWGIGTRPL